MSVTAVLVHGAWQGAWCWERVAALLRSAGHSVVTPTLSGSGTRADALTPEVALTTHVADIVDALPSGPSALVAHSYSGMAAAGVVAAAPDRVRAAVFVDSFVPNTGESAIELMPRAFQDRFRQLAAHEGAGWRLPAGDALLDVWGLDQPDERAWVRERLTDWSLNCFASPSVAPGAPLASIPRWYVAGTKDCPSREVFSPMAARAAAAGCTVVTVDSGHDVMIEQPERLAAVIAHALSAAGSPTAADPTTSPTGGTS